jgi:hypothetical protein
VWLAIQFTNLSIIVYFVWAGLYSLNVDVELRIVAALFCVALVYVLTQTIFKTPIETYEVAAYQRVARGLRNPRRIRDTLLRTSFLTLCLLLAYPVMFVYVNLHLHLVILSYLLIVLTTVVLYLLACDPLPPCMGKVREWTRALSQSRVTVRNPGVKLFVCAVWTLHSQAQSQRTSTAAFDVVSITPNPNASVLRRAGFRPGRFEAVAATVQDLITMAYTGDRM